MPAPAVIPAPIAYIKVVAVKKLVVEIGRGRGGPPLGVNRDLDHVPLLDRPRALYCALGMGQDVYFEKIRVFKAGICSDTLAWNNGIGRRSYFVGF